MVSSAFVNRTCKFYSLRDLSTHMVFQSEEKNIVSEQPIASVHTGLFCFHKEIDVIGLLKSEVRQQFYHF